MHDEFVLAYREVFAACQVLSSWHLALETHLTPLPSDHPPPRDPWFFPLELDPFSSLNATIPSACPVMVPEESTPKLHVVVGSSHRDENMLPFLDLCVQQKVTCSFCTSYMGMLRISTTSVASASSAPLVKNPQNRELAALPQNGSRCLPHNCERNCQRHHSNHQPNSCVLQIISGCVFECVLLCVPFYVSPCPSGCGSRSCFEIGLQSTAAPAKPFTWHPFLIVQT